MVAKCCIDDEAAAQACLANVQAGLALRSREEEDRSDNKAWKFAGLRIKQEQDHLVALRERLSEVDHSAARTLVIACHIIELELKRALERAHKPGLSQRLQASDDSMAVSLPDVPDSLRVKGTTVEVVEINLDDI